MKKHFLICFALLLCLAILLGCQPQDESSSLIPIVSSDASEDASSDVSEDASSDVSEDASSDVSEDVSSDVSDTTFEDESKSERDEVIHEGGFLKGTLVDKIAPNILVIDQTFFLPFGICEDGIIHATTDDIDEWCIGDDLTVWFSQITCPSDPTQPITVPATEIYISDNAIQQPEKPIIYLYPELPTVCSVKLLLNGVLTATYPSYENGWDNFTAYPDGTLVFPDGKEYYALFWEGIQNTAYDFTKGFCVKGEDTTEFLEWALLKLGLTSREANEFIIYWAPRMQSNPYNVISFQYEAYTDGAELEISPSPDSLLRVFMAYYSSNEKVDIESQELCGFERRGFTVVEWGGAEIN